MPDNVYDIGVGTEVDNKNLKKGLKDAKKDVDGFAKEANKSLGGIDFTKLLAPAAIAGASVAALTKLKGALDDMAAAYRVQEEAEAALKNAAKNNPYLNDTAVKQLNQFASEMQRLTGLDSVMITQTQTRLASLGRNQQQIKDILKVAADMAASGVMDFDSAVNELNNSLNGMVKTSGRLYPELKNLSKEALASGQAIEIIAGKVAGSAAEAMKTGTGSIKAYENALGDLKKYVGEGWEQATRPAREWLTGIINMVNDAIKAKKEMFEMLKNEEADVEELFSNLNTAEKKELVNLGYKAGGLIQQSINELMLEGLDILSATEQSVRDVAKANGVNVELLRKVTVENKHTNEELKNNLILLEKKTRAEREADIARKASAKAIAVYQERNTQATTEEINALFNAMFKANEAYNAALEAAATGNAAAAKAAREKAQEFMELAETENEKIEKRVADQAKANEILEENRKALEEEIKKIERKAKLEGKSLDDLEVRKQKIDAETQAYESLLTAAKGYLDLIDDETILSNLEKQWEKYRKLVITEEERKKRLAELMKLQEELAGKLGKVYEDAANEASKLYDTGEEAKFQSELAEIRKKSLEDAIKFEAEHRETQRRQEYAKQIRAIAENEEAQRETLRNAMNMELEAAKNNEALKLKIKEKYNEDVKKLDEDLNKAREQLHANLLEQNRQAEAETLRAIKELHEKSAEDIADAYLKKWTEILSKTQDYLNAASSIASSISAMWTNNIDYETNEKLKANDKIIQSDEERAAKEKEINIRAANERYKAELFAWTANVNMATAQAAMGMLTAYTEGLKGGGTMAPAIAAMQMALAAAIGAMQVAAVISARPKPPRFHSGGVVQGKGEQSAILKGGEVVQTQKQFQNTMQAINNLANNGTGGGVQMNVKIENNASNKVRAEPQMTVDGLKLVITEIVNEGFGNGSFDRGVAIQQSNLQGRSLL